MTARQQDLSTDKQETDAVTLIKDRIRSLEKDASEPETLSELHHLASRLRLAQRAKDRRKEKHHEV